MFSKQNVNLSNVARLFSLLFVSLIMSVSLSACGSDDDEPDSGINDYYSTCEEVVGDQISSQESDALKTAIARALSGTWQNINKEQAVYYFDREVRNMAEVLEETYDDLALRGTVNVTLALRTVSDGKNIKRAYIEVNKNGAYVK